jgi:hypothetical protein
MKVHLSPKWRRTTLPSRRMWLGSVHCKIISWLFRTGITGVEIQIICLEVKDGNSFKGAG